MSISKTALYFDPAVGGTDSVGSYLIGKTGNVVDSKTISASEWLQVASAMFAADGTAITQTGGALDIHVSNASIAVTGTFWQAVQPVSGTFWQAIQPVSGTVTANQGTSPWVVSATSFDIRHLSHTTDSVQSYTVDGSGNAITSTTGFLDVYNHSHLAQGTDAVTAYQGTSPWVVSGTVGVSGTVAVTQSTSPWVVSATAFDIRHLAAATDAVSAWTKDGAGNSIGSHTGALDVYLTNPSTNDPETCNTAILSSQVNVSNTRIALPASPLAARKMLLVQNLGVSTSFVGDSSVTAANGIQLFQNSSIELLLGPALSLHAIGTTAPNRDFRVLELA